LNDLLGAPHSRLPDCDREYRRNRRGSSKPKNRLTKCGAWLAAEHQRLKELNKVVRQTAEHFPNAAFARPNHREQSTDAGTKTILAFDLSTTHTLPENARPSFEVNSLAPNV